jgi:hypothetical protein
VSGYVCESCSACFDDPVCTDQGLMCPLCGSLCVCNVGLFDYEEAVNF